MDRTSTADERSVGAEVTSEPARELRDLVSLGCRVLGSAEQGDLIWGHVSARDPQGRGVWMKASGLGFEEVSPDDLLLVSWDGEVLSGDGRRHAEFPIHTEVMRARAEVGSVIHTHSPSAVALGALGVPLRPISHEANLFDLQAKYAEVVDEDVAIDYLGSLT